MTEIGKFATEYAAPALRDAGFSRKGNKFWLSTATGDAALLKFAPSRFKTLSGTNAAEITIHQALCLAAAASFRGTPPGQEQKRLEADGMVWLSELTPPVGAKIEKYGPWAYRNSLERHAVGQILRDVLGDVVIPRLRKIDNTDALVSFIEMAEREEISRVSLPALRLDALAHIGFPADNKMLEFWIDRAKLENDERLCEWLVHQRSSLAQ